MSLLQKWLAWLVGLGALGMVVANPDAIYKGAKSFETVTAGSVVAVSTAGKGKATY